MNPINKTVKVTSGYYEGIEGKVTGVTLDGYLLVKPETSDAFFVKQNEVMFLD